MAPDEAAKRLDELERRADRMRDVVFGSREEGTRSLRAEIEARVVERIAALEERVVEAESVAAAANERADKLERRLQREEDMKAGLRRAVGYSGATSLLNLVTLIVGIVGLYGVLT